MRLNKFMERAAPILESVLDENLFISQIGNTSAQKKNPVEVKGNIKCPEEVKKYFNAEVSKITSKIYNQLIRHPFL